MKLSQCEISLDVVSQLLESGPQLLHVLGDRVKVHERRLDVRRPLLVVQRIVQDNLSFIIVPISMFFWVGWDLIRLPVELVGLALVDLPQLLLKVRSL